MVKNIVILGSGALATFYAFEWCKYFEISVIASWQNSIEALNSGKNQVGHKVEATSDWEKTKEPDLVVWITKTYKNQKSLDKYSILNWKCPILILQNGIGQEALFKKKLGANQKIFRGITSQGANLIRPGYVLNTGHGEVFVEKAIIFDNLPFVQTDDIQTLVYLKLAINAVLNPITAIFKVSNIEALLGDAGQKLRKLIKICYPYFERRKVFSSEEEYLYQVELAAKLTGSNKNSMLADKEFKRPTEVPNILVPINKELKSKEIDEIISLLNL